MSDEAINDCPDILYHYTNAIGIKGILNPARWPFGRRDKPAHEKRIFLNDDDYTYGHAAHLMASDVRYMNDTAELLFGARIMRERLAVALDDSTLDDKLRSAFDRVKESLAPEGLHEWPWQFAACFCEQGDLLSQWRGYSKGMGGFAIGFSSEALRSYAYGVTIASNGMIADTASRVGLFRVIYGEAAAVVKVDAVISSIAHDWKFGSCSADRRWPFIIGADGLPTYSVALMIMETIATLKHEGFSAENEWRLLGYSDRHYKVNTRGSKSGLIPYRDFLVNARVSDDPNALAPHAVKRIVVGPARDQKAQVNAVKLLLHQRGYTWYDDIEVVPSGIPFVA